MELILWFLQFTGMNSGLLNHVNSSVQSASAVATLPQSGEISTKHYLTQGLRITDYEAIARQHHARTYLEPINESSLDYGFETRLLDIDHDGDLDIYYIVYPNTNWANGYFPDYNASINQLNAAIGCTDNGCPHVVIRNDGNRWKPIFTWQADHVEIMGSYRTYNYSTIRVRNYSDYSSAIDFQFTPEHDVYDIVSY